MKTDVSCLNGLLHLNVVYIYLKLSVADDTLSRVLDISYEFENFLSRILELIDTTPTVFEIKFVCIVSYLDYLVSINRKVR